LLPSFDKSDLESDFEISLESISTIQETYSNIEQINKVAKFKSKVVKDLIKEFYKELGHVKNKTRLAPGENIALDTVNLFKNVKINGDWIGKEISDAVNDVVVSGALTAYKANLLRSVAHYFFLTRFAMDLANFFYVEEAEESGMELGKDYKLNNKQKEFIVKNMWVYARMMAVYGQDHDDFKGKLEGIDEITLPKEQIDEVMDIYTASKVDMFDNLPNNFIGSPIYSIRMVFAQWESQRYKNLKDKKKLLELRFLHLKLVKEQGQSDVNMEKEIEYLQRRITDVDFELSKIEKDLED
jgi:hypothetical protein